MAEIDPQGFEANAWRRRIWLAMWNATVFYEECKDGDHMYTHCDETTPIMEQAAKAGLALKNGRRPRAGTFMNWARGWQEATGFTGASK